MSKPPAFQLYADDFLAGTITMTDAQVGAYIRLLCVQWTKGGVPDDGKRIRRIVPDVPDDELDEVLDKFDACEDGQLRNARLEQVRSVLEARIEAGSRGGTQKHANRVTTTKQTSSKPPSKVLANAKQTSSKPPSKVLANELANRVAKSYPPSPSPSPSPSPVPITEPDSEPVPAPEQRAVDAGASTRRDGDRDRVASADIDAVVDAYQRHHPRAKPADRERKLIAARLREGRTVADLIDAVEGCHISPHHCGENSTGTKYQSLELIVRDAKHVDQFIEVWHNRGDPVLSERTRRNQRAMESFLARSDL